MAFIAVRTISTGTCTGRGCAAHGPITLVYSEARFRHDPDAPNVSAWLCAACLTKLGDRLQPIDLTGTGRSPGGYLYRGKPVPSF